MGNVDKVERATNYYIEDILMYKTEVIDKLINNLKKFGLNTKLPEKNSNSGVQIKERQSRQNSFFLKGNKIQNQSKSAGTLLYIWKVGRPLCYWGMTELYITILNEELKEWPEENKVGKKIL